jgi:hypothetical protein
MLSVMFFLARSNVLMSLHISWTMVSLSRDFCWIDFLSNLDFADEFLGKNVSIVEFDFGLLVEQGVLVDVLQDLLVQAFDFLFDFVDLAVQILQRVLVWELLVDVLDRVEVLLVENVEYVFH